MKNIDYDHIELKIEKNDILSIKNILQKLFENNNNKKLRIRSLHLTHSSLTSLSFLNDYIKFETLENFNCSENSLIFIGIKLDLESLMSLDCSSNRIPILDSIIKSVGTNNNLTTLILENCSLLSIEGIQSFYNLRKLVLKNNKLYNISELSYLKELEYLDFSSNNIININAIEGLYNLTTLIFSQNNVSNISCLYGLTKVRHLDISMNKKIISLTGVQNMKMLECIICDFCGIHSLIELQGNSNIRKISIESNNLDSIDDILTMENLKELNIKYNKIKRYQINKRYIDYIISYFFPKEHDPITEKFKSLDLLEK